VVIHNFTRHRYRLRADCLRCKRVTIMDPLALLQRCQARGWSRDALAHFLLFCSRAMSHSIAMSRRSDFAEIEFGFLAFLIAVSMEYPAVRWLLAMIGAFFG